MEINEAMTILGEYDTKLPHCSNLKTKLSAEKNVAKLALLAEIATLYISYHDRLVGLSSEDDQEKWLRAALAYFEDYYKELRSDKYKVFSHQSDFLSSLLPEFLYFLYRKFITDSNSNYRVETQKDIVIDIVFLPYSTSKIIFKSKRVDVAIVKPSVLTFDTETTDPFNIPVVAVEVKTNLDKNMIGGVEYSVERMKRSFPLANYYLVTEFADFAYEKQNYASSSIDEIIVTRKQKRSEMRNDSSKIVAIDLNLMLEHIREVQTNIEESSSEPDNLKHRLDRGKLIK